MNRREPEVWAVASPSDFPDDAAETWGLETTQGLISPQGRSWLLPAEFIDRQSAEGEKQ